MKTFYIFVNIIFVIFTFPAYAQKIELLYEREKVSLRGLSAVNDKIVWVSGTSGNVGKSIDGGQTWSWKKVAGYESRDFRDIEAFNASEAIIMAVGEPAIILKTADGGSTWKKVYENDKKGMFLDAIEFWNGQNGVVIGDPIDGKFFVAGTSDGGNSWRETGPVNAPAAESGEACFAASGTNLRMRDKENFCFVTGGTVSRLIWKERVVQLPLLQGAESQGANAIALWQGKKKFPQIVIVGGDFTKDSLKTGNCTVSRDGGKTWIKPSNPPYGYRSCVEYISDKRLITCGINGVDISFDEGINWNSISATGFHVCRKAKQGNTVFLAGGNGRIAKLVW